MIRDFSGLNIHIVGVSGAEGSAILEFLFTQGVKEITVHDFMDKKDFIKNFSLFNSKLPKEVRSKRLGILKEKTIKKHYKKTYLEGIMDADIIFAGQAWYKYECNFPHLKNALDSGIQVENMINLYLDYFPGTKIGITGSNGKTTVTSLTHHLISHILNMMENETPEQRQVYIAGNIDSVADDLNRIITESNKLDILVLEVSNRQLKQLGTSHADISVVTNITENHLNEHDGFEDYARAKLALTQNSIAILNANDKTTKNLHNKYTKNSLETKWFNSSDIKKFDLTKVDVPLKGTHNLENLASALCVLETLKQKGLLSFKNSDIKNALKSHKTVTKRLEYIGDLKGVKIINDLSSTTPISTLAAIDAFKNEPFSIVLGCDHKHTSYIDLIKTLEELQGTQILKHIFVLEGTVREILNKTNLTYSEVQDFTEIKNFIVTNSKDEAPFEIGSYLLVSPSGEKVISGPLKHKPLSTYLLQ